MIYVILRFGIMVEYQLQVRDVFPSALRQVARWAQNAA